MAHSSPGEAGTLESKLSAGLAATLVACSDPGAPGRRPNASFYDMLALVERGHELHRSDAGLSAQLERIFSELRAKEREQDG
jgi:hypothetical protein